MIQPPVRLDRLQEGLFDMVESAFAGASVSGKWSYDEASYTTLDGDLITMTMTGGPSPGLRQRSQGILLAPADSVVIRVTAATVGVRDIVRLNGFDYRHDVVGGDTVTTIRDDLLAQINAGELYTGAVVATADGADGILLTAQFLGGLRSLELLGEMGNDAPAFSGDAVLVTDATVVSLITFQAFSKQRNVRGGAWNLISIIYAALRAHDLVEELRRFGLGVWGKGSITDLTAIAGGHWETRAALDATIATRSTFVRPVSQIDTVNMNLNLDTGDSIVSETFTVVSP